MGSATWRATGLVEGSPDEVYAWMTDFTSDDHNSEAFKRGAGVKPGKKQKPSMRIVESRDANVLRIKDEWGGSAYTSTVTLDPVQRTVRIQGGMRYDSTWRATAEGPSTRVTVEGSMGKGILGSIMALFERKIQKSMERDFHGHMEDLRETLQARGKGT